MFGQKKDSATPAPEAPEAAAPAAADAQPAAPPPAGPSAREAELEAQLAQFKENTIRQLAEAENARKRAEREIEEARKFAVSGFARDLLAVADNLRRALDSVPAEKREASAEIKNLLVGVEATERQLLGTFEKFGVQAIPAMGQPFDPNFHQAMQEAESADAPPGTVIQVYQSGFTISDRLLRPALVVVSTGSSKGSVDTKA
jgi:molecular chaperone GrpE